MMSGARKFRRVGRDHVLRRAGLFESGARIRRQTARERMGARQKSNERAIRRRVSHGTIDRKLHLLARTLELGCNRQPGATAVAFGGRDAVSQLRDQFNRVVEGALEYRVRLHRGRGFRGLFCP